MDIYKYAYNKTEEKIIKKLNSLNNPETFFNDVRRFTRQITTDHNIKTWERFSEIRYNEITEKNKTLKARYNNYDFMHRNSSSY